MKFSGILSVVFFLTSIQTSSANCLSGNCYNGKGTFVYPSGAKYIGEFRKGKIHGTGILFFSNGNKYDGNWVNQYREGNGKLIFTNGDVYKGKFKKSKFHGEGTMKFANGEKYVGEWANDEQNGFGKYYYNNDDVYEGHFKNGTLDGKGKMFYHDGTKYFGTWSNNYKDGQGTFFKADGSKVAGLWSNGKFMPAQQDAVIEDAVVVNNSNTMADLEKDEFVDKSSERNCNKQYCKGGTGFYTYSDNSKYSGEFKNGYPEGYGRCYYANGDKYVGNWKSHAPHGKGTMHYKSGQVLTAVWKYGTPDQGFKPDDSKINNEKIAVNKNKKVKIWAVVVGVARYSHMPVLKYTDDDAYQIFAFLKSPEGGALPDSQIKVLVDDDATRTNILRTMRRTFLQADENDVVVLYFSGHGLPGSFLPFDFDGFNNKLDHDDIKNILNESKAKHKLCIADACHAGTLTAAKTGGVPSTLTNYYDAFEKSKGGTALLLSSKGDEFSLEDHGLRQGIFSHFLIRGMKGEADVNNNQIVTVKELFNFVHKKVRSYTGNVQSPILQGEFDRSMPVAAIRK